MNQSPGEGLGFRAPPGQERDAAVPRVVPEGCWAAGTPNTCLWGGLRALCSLGFVPQALRVPGAVLKPEVTWPLACWWWEDAAAPGILQDMGDGIPCFRTVKGEVLGPLRGENPPFPEVFARGDCRTPRLPQPHDEHNPGSFFKSKRGT